MAIWREMNHGDIPGVMALADSIHPGLIERAEVFGERQRLFPDGCLVADRGGRILGYAVSHPIAPANPPRLDTLLGGLAQGERHYYIHDFALSPVLRGSGLARAGVDKLLAIAGGFPKTALISVYGTMRFWSRFGFQPSAQDLAAKLAAYGEGAVYMERTPAACGAGR
ncbi:GNAT family N-acetyltransferase [Parapusillimonas granuli]|uniref:GNAT family N-acetyltransferase n=1 Tax=Parapusillimonas granuli TaxID=380911 RepID=A0A853FYH7_9BURK|nr:GNAT family N-acetyltransferase [Parapusillimonas granuli]MBB5214462.1 GNAT superfamily N-acetyltransferase [Parapusillimonas granuli]MEB2398286.1 GNAT family N-acetyltransferase [Alcaligenaceae bacterium]NYT49129.1 GNAT family N-acetyltransferase [Parapusillimonas granuli]